MNNAYLEVTSWVGSEEIPVRILKKDYSVVCKIYKYISGEMPEFASYIKDSRSAENFSLIGKTRSLEEAKFFCNLALKSQGYSISLLDI